jgi:hypothetical protein
MTAVCTVVLQVCMELVREVPDSSREACLTSPDAYHFIDIKVEEVSVIDEGEDPLLVTSPRRKAGKREVSPLQSDIQRAS